MKHLLYILLFIIPEISIGQAGDSSFNPKAFDQRSLEKVEKNINSLERKIDKETAGVLARLQAQEATLKRKLGKKDSLAANVLFNAETKYTILQSKLKFSADKIKLKEYIPQFDSLRIGFKFLENAKDISGNFSKEWVAKLKAVNGSIQGLENRMQQAGEVQAFIKERKQRIKEQLERYGLGKHLKKMNKEVYYYQQQMSEYKALLKDPAKMQQRAITELRKLPAFKNFMQKNSQLASLFKLPEHYGTPQSLAGLQTRVSVQNQLQQRFGGTGINPQQYVQQQMQQATTALNALKDKLNKLGGGSTDIEMPDFKPNTQKTKNFLERIEYDANVQSQKTNRLLPVTSDFALTIGYKLNDKSIIGVGASYKLGWGSGIEHLKLSHQGVGLRSYVDIKVKGSVWLSGGYEQNYQYAFTKMTELKKYDTWQTSGLIGLTKKYKIGKKTNNLQLLWDFMSYQQLPRRQALVFRVGFKF